jgi:hypothetical protein
MSAPPRDEIIRNLENVRGGESGFPVQLIVDGETGRWMIRGVNEGGFACVDIDLLDLVAWLSDLAPGAIDHAKLIRAITAC